MKQPIIITAWKVKLSFNPIPTRVGGGVGGGGEGLWFFAPNFWNFYLIDLKFGDFF